MMKMNIPKILEILTQFKGSCQRKGWETSEWYDWIKANGDYHNFLWTKTVHTSSFKRIASNKRCIVPKGLSYQVVEPSYTAWLFSEPFPETLIKAITDDADLASRIAVYDLSLMTDSKNQCAKLNRTDSQVFRDSESFLTNELGVSFRPIPIASEIDVTTDDCTIAEMS